MPLAVNMVGFKSGRLTVIARTEGKDKTCAYWQCQCECGNTTIQRGKDLRTGKVKSCGCMKRQPIGGSATLTHGHSRFYKSTPTYQTWMNMNQRCNNPKHPDYRHYGGRGIAICERWKTFENFLADMGERPDGKTIDRHPNNNGNYEPGNCRWANQSEQMSNSRATHWITFNGETLTLTQWAQRLEVSPACLSSRLRIWTQQRAMTTIGKLF